MGVLENIANAAANSTVNSNVGANANPFAGVGYPTKEEKPKATVYVNVGYQGADEFISIPLGIALDTMQEVNESSTNPKMAKILKAKNELLRNLLEFILANTNPGETLNLSEALPGLTLQARRVGENVQVGDNEYAMDFSQLMRPAKKAG